MPLPPESCRVVGRVVRAVFGVLATCLVAVACGGGDAATVSVHERIDYGDDPAQYGWLDVPTGFDADLPVVVLVHGGFWGEPWDYTLMDPFIEPLNAAGIATWNIEFRRLGGRGGWPSTFDDVTNAMAALVELAEVHPLDLSRVTTFGHSSGGHLALWMIRDEPSAEHGIAGARAVGLSAVTDLTQTTRSEALLGGTSADLPDRYADAAPLLDPRRVLLIHGDRDDIVPIGITDDAVADGVPIQVLEGVEHFKVITAGEPAFDETVSALIEFVEAS